MSRRLIRLATSLSATGWAIKDIDSSRVDGRRNHQQPILWALISGREAAERGGLSAGHLQLLVNSGRLWPVKLGRSWVTTAKAVQEYTVQRQGRPQIA